MNNTMTVAITAENEKKIQDLLKTRPGKTERELVQQMFEQGLYQIVYRTKQNQKKGEEQKMFRVWMKQMREKGVDVLKGSERMEEV